MQTAYISCINKNERLNQYERIQYVGGQNANGTHWKQTVNKTIEEIESGKWSFFVKKRGDGIKVIVATSPYGNKYIKTEADGEKPDNLLSLPECT